MWDSSASKFRPSDPFHIRGLYALPVSDCIAGHFIDAALALRTSPESGKLADYSPSRNSASSLRVKPFFMSRSREPTIVSQPRYTDKIFEKSIRYCPAMYLW